VLWHGQGLGLGDVDAHVNNTQRGVDCQMQIDNARSKLKSIYPKIKLCQNASGQTDLQ